MIVTVTPNPALDLTYRVSELQPGEVNRVPVPETRAGGKGLNVARLLHALPDPHAADAPASPGGPPSGGSASGRGTAVVALGFAGGPDGDALAAGLVAAGVPHDLVRISGRTRRTVALVDDTAVTMLNEPGPAVTEAEWAALRERVASWLPRASVLVLSGSLPPGAPDDGYATLIADARRHGVPTVLDTSGPALVAALGSRPTVVKPNASELAAAGPLSPRATSLPPTTGERDALQVGTARLRERGAEAVVASDGPRGLYADTPSGRWQVTPPEVRGGNPTGAGDAVVAAIAAGLAHGWDWPRTLTGAAALSAAAVRSPLAGEADLIAYHDNLHRIVIRDLAVRAVSEEQPCP